LKTITEILLYQETRTYVQKAELNESKEHLPLFEHKRSVHRPKSTMSSEKKHATITNKNLRQHAHLTTEAHVYYACAKCLYQSHVKLFTYTAENEVRRPLRCVP